MKTCLVTGAMGQLGSAICKKLQNDYQIIKLVHRPEQAGDGNVFLDLSKPWDEKCLPSNIDIVFHLAQSNHFRDFPHQAHDIFAVNVASTLNLLDYARRSHCQKFIFTSSGGVYGAGGHSFSENTTINYDQQLGFYLDSKLCAETLLKNYADYMDITILRPFFIYGPQQKSDMLIPRLIHTVNEGKPITLNNQDGIKLNPIYVEDAASLTANTIPLTGMNTINLAGNEILSLRQIGEIIGNTLQKEPLFSITEEHHSNHLVADTAMMEKLLGKPTTDMATGITNIVETYFR